MKIGMFYYDGFAEFELVLCSLYFCEHDLFSLSLEKKEILSLEKQRFCVDRIIKETNPIDIDLLIIPGGNPNFIYENSELKEFIERILANNGKIAGICGGSELLASLGILDNKKCTGDSEGISEKSGSYKYYEKAIIINEYIVKDGNIITGQGRAFIQFAIEVAKEMGVIKSDEEGYNDLKMFRNI